METARLMLCPILAFIMPMGLVLRGLAGGSMAYAPVVMIGAVFPLSSAAILIKGAVNMKKYQ